MKVIGIRLVALTADYTAGETTDTGRLIDVWYPQVQGVDVELPNLKAQFAARGPVVVEHGFRACPDAYWLPVRNAAEHTAYLGQDRHVVEARSSELHPAGCQRRGVREQLDRIAAVVDEDTVDVPLRVDRSGRHR